MQRDVNQSIQQSDSRIYNPFEFNATLEARGSDGKLLSLIPRDALPPAVAVLVTYYETYARQTYGQFGSGTKFFIFDAGTVRACEKGQLFIPFVGETYTWNTPFPGCLESL
jgi:hypothetical protein